MTWAEKLERLRKESAEAVSAARTADEIAHAERLCNLFHASVCEFRDAGFPNVAAPLPPHMTLN